MAFLLRGRWLSARGAVLLSSLVPSPTGCVVLAGSLRRGGACCQRRDASDPGRACDQFLPQLGAVVMAWCFWARRDASAPEAAVRYAAEKGRLASTRKHAVRG